jgi:hypothetical protein
MIRRFKRTASRARRQPPRRPGNGKAIALLGTAFIVAAGLLMLGQASSDIPRDDDLCRVGMALPVIEVWQIDATERLTPDEAGGVAAAIRRSAERLPVESKLMISVLQPDGQSNARVLFARCKPRTGEGANALYENGRLLGKHYREGFAEPLETALDALAQLGAADTSPIAEWLYEASAAFEGPAASKRLIVVSDLLQFSDRMSMYRSYDWQSFLRLPKVRAIQGRLSGVDVLVLLRLHERSGALQGDKHERCWRSYFGYAGAREFQIRPL